MCIRDRLVFTHLTSLCFGLDFSWNYRFWLVCLRISSITRFYRFFEVTLSKVKNETHLVFCRPNFAFTCYYCSYINLQQYYNRFYKFLKPVLDYNYRFYLINKTNFTHHKKYHFYLDTRK